MAGHTLRPDALRDEILKLADEPSKLYEWLRLRIPLLIGPGITSFTPTTGFGGTLIQIDGYYFSEKREDNAVTIAGKPARVISATDSQLLVIAPHDVVTGPIE